MIHVPENITVSDSKTGKRDVVSDEVMELLGTIGQAKGNPRRGLVVCSKAGNKLHSLGASWRMVRQLARIPDVWIPELRHSVASDAINDGVPLEVVGKMLGHRNYRTTSATRTSLIPHCARRLIGQARRSSVSAMAGPRRVHGRVLARQADDIVLRRAFHFSSAALE